MISLLHLRTVQAVVLTLCLLATGIGARVLTVRTPAPLAPPLLFGTNLALYDQNDQFLTSAATRQQFTAMGVQLIRVPIRTVGGISPWEVQALQLIKSVQAVPMIILKLSQPDPAAAGQAVLAQAETIFGPSAPIYAEFGNERDLDGIDQVAYTATWNAVVPTLKNQFPNVLFGGPVNFQSNPPYIAYFVHNAVPKPDFISWHEYTCGTSDSQTICIQHIANWATHVQATRAAIAANGDAVPPIFITEWNYDPSPPQNDPRDTPAFATQFMETALQELAGLPIAGAAQFLATANPAFQLLNYDGSLTPSGSAFQCMYQEMIQNLAGCGAPLHIATPVPTATATPTVTQTPTSTPTGTPTATPARTATVTPAPSATPAATPAPCAATSTCGRVGALSVTAGLPDAPPQTVPASPTPLPLFVPLPSVTASANHDRARVVLWLLPSATQGTTAADALLSLSVQQQYGAALTLNPLHGAARVWTGFDAVAAVWQIAPSRYVLATLAGGPHRPGRLDLRGLDLGNGTLVQLWSSRPAAAGPSAPALPRCGIALTWHGKQLVLRSGGPAALSLGPGPATCG